MQQIGSSLPLEFEKFKKILKEIDGEIHRLDGCRKLRLARYQTLIAYAGYFGVKSSELLSLKWIDVINKNEKESVNIEGLRIMYFTKNFIELANRNYKLVAPVLSDHLIVSKKLNSMEPISIDQFTQMVSKVFKQRDVPGPYRSWQTLRKTCALEAYRNKGNNSLSHVGKMFGFRSPKEFASYLNITNTENFDVELKFK